MIFLAHSKLFYGFQNSGASIATDGAGNTLEIYIYGLAQSRFFTTMVAGDFVSRVEA
jgi:hypothetical protein